MVQGVYVDILLVINFLVDFLLLSLLARTGGRGTQGGWRRVAAAAAGSLFSLSIFLPPLPHEDLGQLLLPGGLLHADGSPGLCLGRMAAFL